MFISLLIPILMIFFQVGLGAFLNYKKVFSESSAAVFSVLLTNVTMPLMSFSSVAGSLNFETIISAGRFILIMVSTSVCLHFISVVYVLVLRIPEKEKGAHQFTFVQSNTAFLGVAVMTALYGSQTALFVGLIYLTTSFYVNSMGIVALSGAGEFSLLRLIKTPMFLGLASGTVIALSGIPFPAPLLKTLSDIGSMTIPLGMIYTGILMSKMDLKASFTDRNVILTTVCRLIIIPCALNFVLRLFLPADDFLCTIPTIMAMMPAFTLLPVFAGRYGSDENCAAALTAATTFFSLITIPVLSMILL